MIRLDKFFKGGKLLSSSEAMTEIFGTHSDSCIRFLLSTELKTTFNPACSISLILKISLTPSVNGGATD